MSFTVRLAMRSQLRYFVLLGVLVFGLPALAEFAGQGMVHPSRWGLLAVLILGYVFTQLFHPVLATFDESGVCFRRREPIAWDELDQVELAKSPIFRRMYRWAYGTDRVIKFVPKAELSGEQWPERRRWQLECPTIFEFQSSMPVDEIAQRASELGNISITPSED